MKYDPAAISIQPMSAGGPGGQHQNRSLTGVTLVFSISDSGLSEEVAQRLRENAGSRLNQRDEIVIQAREHRSYEQNLRAALKRLEKLLDRACRAPAVRIPTGPSEASRERRLQEKRRRGETKRRRSEDY
jgi:ribosome-associated protein